MEQDTHSRTRLWMGSSLAFLFVASILGLIIRSMVLTGIPVLPYKNMLHAHSHTALLGFGFLFILGSYIFLILPTAKSKKRYFKLLLIYAGTGIGMVAGFLYQSYGPISITFSTIMMLAGYIMVYFFLNDYKKVPPDRKNPLIKWSLYWFLISTLGIWFVGPVTAILGREHELYFLSIQFFLHFQFNGWFTLSILGLLIELAKKRGLGYKINPTGFWLLNAGLVLTFFLSVTVVNDRPVYFFLTSVGAVIQIIAYYLILNPVIIHLVKVLDFRKWRTQLIMTGIGCLILKVLLQGLVAFPSLAVASYSIREFIVGYIHLILLGGMTITTAGILLTEGVLRSNRWNKTGWAGMVITFFIMEVILFSYAILTWQDMGNALFYIRAIFYVTIPFPVFAGCILWGN